MNLTKNIITLKQKGYSQKEIAEKLDITQQAVSLHIVKAQKEGLFNGNIGSNVSEISSGKEEIKLEGQKPKLKGSFKCSRCHKPLIPIDEVTFKPSKLKEVLKQHGFTHVCVNCKIAYAREGKENESSETESEYKCPQCNKPLAKLTAHGKTVGYYCINCKLLFNEEDLKKESKTSQKKNTETLKCPKCGKVASIEEWRKDAWRCRGCAEYLPYKIRSKYFKTSQKENIEDLNFVCPQCEGDVIKTKSGKYRCPKCKMLFDKKELKKE